MTTRRMVTPRSQRQAEQAIERSFAQFGGMVKDSPTTKLNDKYAQRNVNVIDREDWFEVRPGTRQYGEGVCGITYGEEELWGRHFARRSGKIISHVGDQILVHNSDFSSPVSIPIAGTKPSKTPSTFSDYEDDVIMFADGVYRIFLAVAIPYAVKVNTQVPGDDSFLIDPFFNTNIVDGKRYCYRYLVSFSRMSESDYMAGRTSNEILSETGTMRTSDDDPKTFIDVWGSCYIGQTPLSIAAEYPADISLVGSQYWGAGPVASNEIYPSYGLMLKGESDEGGDVSKALSIPYSSPETHASIYRSKEFAKSKGNPAQFIWVADVPMFGCFKISATLVTKPAGYVGVFMTGIPMDLLSGQMYYIEPAFGYGRAFGAYFYLTSSSRFYSEGYCVPLADDTPTTHTFSFGSRRGSKFNVTSKNTLEDYIEAISAGMAFSNSDIGQTVMFDDGTGAIVTGVVTASKISVAKKIGAATIYGVLKDPAYGAKRTYFDVTKDDGKVAGEIGLEERIISGNTLYYPQYSFLPIPDSDIGVVSNGLLLSAKRNGQLLSYTAIGDKPWMAGQYREDEQFENTHAKISAVIGGSQTIAVICTDRTLVVGIDAATMRNIGDPDLGEYIPKLAQFVTADENIGVSQWRTIKMVAPGVHMAVTSEPAVRSFDGSRWSKQNYACAKGVPCIMEDLNSVGQETLQAAYSEADGYIIFGHRLVDDSVLTPEDVVVDSSDNITGGGEWQ